MSVDVNKACLDVENSAEDSPLLVPTWENQWEPSWSTAGLISGKLTGSTVE